MPRAHFVIALMSLCACKAVAFEKGAAELTALDIRLDGSKSIAAQYADLATRAAKLRRDQAGAFLMPDSTVAATHAAYAAAHATNLANAKAMVTEERQLKARLDAICPY